MFFACIAVFCRAFGQCFTKLIQKTYPNDFHTVPFLFLRSFMIVTLSLVHTYFTQVRIISPKEIPFKIWFFYRTNMNFSACPILSYFILKEKYYPRYAVGIIMCLIGSTLIVSNEHKANSSSSSKENSFSDTLKGLIFISLSMLNVSIVTISNKILASNKVPVNTQMVYVGLTTMSYSFIFILCFGELCLRVGTF